jgi:hypothetical protein
MSIQAQLQHHQFQEQMERQQQQQPLPPRISHAQSSDHLMANAGAASKTPLQHSFSYDVMSHAHGVSQDSGMTYVREETNQRATIHVQPKHQQQPHQQGTLLHSIFPSFFIRSLLS